MAHLLAQHVMERSTQLPEDRVINTFHFQTFSDIAVDADYDSVVAQVQEFFRDTVTVGGVQISISDAISLMVGRNPTVLVYNQGDLTPRQPRRRVTYAMGGEPFTGNAILPAEVALVVSFRAAPVGGVPPARLRGRVYVGPLATGGQAVNFVTTSTGDLRPNNELRATLRGAAARLANPGGPIAGVPAWSTFSPRGAGLHTVVSGFVDDAFDTQRRRGRAATARDSF